MNTIRKLGFALALTLMSAATTVAAQDRWPSKPVKVVVPFAPGGSSDATARAITEKLTTMFGQTFFVENRAGASATIGANFVAHAEPDGYTLLVMPGANVVVRKLGMQTGYDPINDFTPVSNLVFAPYVIIGGVQQSWKTLADMVTYAKANPGALGIGNSEITTRLTAEALARAANIKLTNVPYKGGGPIVLDVLGGHLPLGVATGPAVGGFYKDRRVNVLAVSSPKRLAIFPDVPTVAEALRLKQFDSQTWYAFAGPAKMPQAIVDSLSKAVSQILADKAMQDKLLELGLVPAEDTTPAGMRRLMDRFAKENGAIIDAAHIQAE